MAEQVFLQMGRCGQRPVHKGGERWWQRRCFMFKLFLSCHKIRISQDIFQASWTCQALPQGCGVPEPSRTLFSQEERLGRGGWYTEGIICLFPCLQASLPVWLIAVILKLSKPRLGQQHHIHNVYCPQGQVSLPGKSLHRAFFSLTPYCLEFVNSQFL